MKKTVLIAADGFEEVEGLTVVDLLRRAGIICDIASLTDSETVTGAHGIRVAADCAFSAIAANLPDAVILPGGMPGTLHLKEDSRVLDLLRETYERGNLVAAICAAPTVLAKAGLLDGRSATCYPGMESELGRVRYSTEPVVADGRLVTSRGVGTAVPFALELIRQLASESQADSVARSIVWY